MAYQVLARQWRPRFFEQMVGQEAVLKSLIHSLNQNRLHHAYLFTGTRGVGKTSLARIMAKCLNCEQGVSAKPCGQCQTCLEIDQGRSIDLIEIDAASKTKVEDTREILDNVQYAPTKSRFKIYLIDEVHMLSLHSFNALLKTLEEPPAHIKFLLATTDPKKLPITVLSRCLQFCLKNIEPEIISLQLEKILTHENISHDQESLKLISRAATGSMRDALSLLDQAIAYGEGAVKLELTQSMLGVVDTRLILDILQSIAVQDPGKTQKFLKEIMGAATNLLMTAQMMAELLFEISQAQVFLGLPEGRFPLKDIHNLAKLIPRDLVQLYYQISIKAQEDIPLAPSPKLGFEMMILRLYAFSPIRQINPVGQVNFSSPPVQQSMSSPLLGSNLDWPEVSNALNIQGMVKQLATNAGLIKYDGKNLVLSVAKQHVSLVSEVLIEKLEKALSEYLKTAIHLEIRTADSVEANPLITPAKIRVDQKEAAQRSAVDSLEDDLVARYIQTQFSAKISPDSVKPISQEKL